MANNKVGNIVYAKCHTEVHEGSIYDSQLDGYREMFQFRNCSGRTLFLTKRNGLRLEFKPSRFSTFTNFYITQQVDVPSTMVDYVRNRLIINHNDSTVQYEKFKDEFLKKAMNTSSSISVKLRHSLDLDYIEGLGGTVYVGDLDILLSTSQYDVRPHPYSPEGLHYPGYDRRQYPDHGCIVEIIDSRDTIGKRYVNMNGQVVCIVPDRTYEKPDGLYVRTLSHVMSGQDDPATADKYYPPHEMDELDWVHRSYSQAIDVNTSELDRKLRLEEMEARNRELEIENKERGLRLTAEKSELERIVAQQKAEQEARAREHDAQQNKLKRLELQLSEKIAKEDHRRKKQAMKMKDHYEEKSLKRKDTSEWTKFIPTILVGIGAIAVAIKSLF